MREKTTQEIQQEKRLKDNMNRIKHKLIVISGKGGVGKTTVAVNLAYGLAMSGHKVGILDVDIHGPNIAKMLGVEGSKLAGSQSGWIEPIEVLPNLKAVSIAFMIDSPDKPIIWRGPLKMITIKQFLSDVNWGKLDYLIIDSPPGTGDEPLSVCQLIPDIDGAIIVTTPQDVAILDSRKSVLFAQTLKMKVIGIIENMSGFICPHCKERTDLFKSGGGEKSAKELKVPFLGRIPIEPEIVASGDSGNPYIHFQKNTDTAKIIKTISRKIEEFVSGKAAERE
ncbi:MAG: Mrp/NBP35 family ATP-binding protein [bacterium]|nr:Mrp/NBP35 family ATP-binding protein [bacterium]